MRHLAVIALLVLCGCKSPPPAKPVEPPKAIELRCHCWIHREFHGTTGCPCDADCDCKPKAKCGCECHCGEPKK
jgi:hypothetical protein